MYMLAAYWVTYLTVIHWQVRSRMKLRKLMRYKFKIKSLLLQELDNGKQWLHIWLCSWVYFVTTGFLVQSYSRATWAWWSMRWGWNLMQVYHAEMVCVCMHTHVHAHAFFTNKMCKHWWKNRYTGALKQKKPVILILLQYSLGPHALIKG